MARRKRKEKEINIRVGDDINTAKVGEFCYYLDYDNSIKWGEINRIFEEKHGVVFEVRCQTDYRYTCILPEYCSFNETDLKKMKRR